MEKYGAIWAIRDVLLKELLPCSEFSYQAFPLFSCQIIPILFQGRLQCSLNLLKIRCWMKKSYLETCTWFSRELEVTLGIRSLVPLGTSPAILGPGSYALPFLSSFFVDASQGDKFGSLLWIAREQLLLFSAIITKKTYFKVSLLFSLTTK